MYSDSDDSQPHLLIKKKTAKTASVQVGEDVVDREKKDLIILENLSVNLIDIEDDKQIIPSTSYKSSKSPIDRLLMKSSSDSESDESSLIDDYSIDDEDDFCKKYFNKSQQTSPTLLDSLNRLESPVLSPEIEPFKSKYLKNLHQQQCFNLKQSIESLNTRPGSNLELERYSTKYESNLEINVPKRKRYGVFNFEFDEELFYKVKKSFPQVSGEKIRTFMFKHHNQEHDVIAATIKSLSPKRERKLLKHQTQMDKVLGHYFKEYKQIDYLDEERKKLATKDEDNKDHDYAKVQIKITYLKLLYPESDLLELFYLLHEYDMKANIVAKKLEEKGFKRNSLSESKESLVSSLHFQELMPELKLTFGEQQNRVTNLKQEFPLIDDYLVKTSLVCTKFNINEARKLLEKVDINEYKNAKTYEYNFKIDDSNYIHLCDRSTQTSVIDYYEFGGTYKKKFKKNKVQTKCISTWTGEDNMEIIINKKIAIGCDPKNYRGPAKKEKTFLIKPKGPDFKNCLGHNSLFSKGPNPIFCKGSDPKNLKKTKSLANGPDSKNYKGSFKINGKEESEYETITNLFININIGV